MNYFSTDEFIEPQIDDIIETYEEIKKREDRIINLLAKYIQMKISEKGIDLVKHLGWKKDDIELILNHKKDNPCDHFLKVKIHMMAKDINICELMKVNN